MKTTTTPSPSLQLNINCSWIAYCSRNITCIDWK